MSVNVIKTALTCLFTLGVMCHLVGCATPLQKATMQGDTKRIETLLNQGHGINEFKTWPAKYPDMMIPSPPAWIAVHNNDENTLRFLLDKGASMDWKATEGEDTLLHKAAERGRTSASIVELLISRGCDVNAFRSGSHIQRLTPLHLAVQTGDSDIVSLLLERGADPHLRTSKGHSPLDIAKMFKQANVPQQRKIIEILEKAMNQRPAALGLGSVVAPPIEVPEMNVPE